MTRGPTLIREPGAVRRLAKLIGKSLTQAVRIAADEALARRPRTDQETCAKRLARLEEIGRRAAWLPIVGPKLTDEFHANRPAQRARGRPSLGRRGLQPSSASSSAGTFSGA